LGRNHCQGCSTRSTEWEDCSLIARHDRLRRLRIFRLRIFLSRYGISTE
jgi:hypothetical protein